MSDLINTAQSTLFNRVITILEDARGNVVRAVNSNIEVDPTVKTKKGRV